MSPVSGMHIIISVNGVNPQTSNENGGFTFLVPNDNLPDSILINAQSNTTGFKNKRISRENYTKSCDIVVDTPKMVASKLTRVPKKDLCSSLLRPLRQYLKTSAVQYADYVKGYPYEKATEIYKLDKRMYELIKKNTPLIPDSLGTDIGLLIQHFSIWTKAYENKITAGPRESNAEFRILYEGSKFPGESAKRILAAGNCN